MASDLVLSATKSARVLQYPGIAASGSILTGSMGLLESRKWICAPVETRGCLPNKRTLRFSIHFNARCAQSRRNTELEAIFAELLDSKRPPRGSRTAETVTPVKHRRQHIRFIGANAHFPQSNVTRRQGSLKVGQPDVNTARKRARLVRADRAKSIYCGTKILKGAKAGRITHKSSPTKFEHILVN